MNNIEENDKIIADIVRIIKQMPATDLDDPNIDWEGEFVMGIDHFTLWGN